MPFPAGPARGPQAEKRKRAHTALSPYWPRPPASRHLPGKEVAPVGSRSSLAGAAAIMEVIMRALNVLTLVLLIVGGLNWGLVGLADFDLVAAIFGDMSPLSRIVYVLVGASALWQIVPLLKGRE